MILGNLAASLLGDMLAGKPKIPRQEVIRAGEEQLEQVRVFNATSFFN